MDRATIAGALMISGLYDIGRAPRNSYQAVYYGDEATFAARGRWPEMRWLAGHNHLSSVAQIGSPDDDLGPLIEGFIARH